MKVILLEDDQVKNVSDGYARNYLLPRKLAILATPDAVKAVEKRSGQKMAELEKKRAEMQALADKLSALEFTVSADAGEGGKLFGSVTSSDIAAAVKSAAGVELDKKKIDLTDPIKMAGDFVVSAKLFQDIAVQLKIKVAPK